MKIPKPKKCATGYKIQLRIAGKSIMVHGTTASECKQRAAQLKSNLQCTGTDDGFKAINYTLRDAIDDYITLKQSTLSPATLRTYRMYQRNRFQSIMDLQIDKLTQRNLQEAINEELEKLAPKSVKSTWGFIASVLSQKMQVPSVSLAKVIPKREATWLTADEIRTFLPYAFNSQYAVPLMLALNSMRIAEIDALTWEDIGEDFIRINKVRVMRSGGEWVTKQGAKNATSVRNLPIIIPELKQAISRDRTHGKVMKCNQMTLRRELERICKAAGLPNVGIHGLRHSFASLSCSLGVPVNVAKEIAGWSKSSQTMEQIYTHIAQSDISRYTNAYASFFGNQK